MKPMKLLSINMIIILGLLVSMCSQEKKKSNNRDSKPEKTLEYSRQITFTTAGGDSITTIQAALADEPEERNEGLMNVTNLPPDKGMLFIFEDEEPRSFWMANTPLSLDIMFVNSDYEIVRIHRNTEAFSEKNLSSGEPAQYVVETNGGFSVSHDIREGMQISVSELE